MAQSRLDTVLVSVLSPGQLQNMYACLTFVQQKQTSAEDIFAAKCETFDQAVLKYFLSVLFNLFGYR